MSSLSQHWPERSEVADGGFVETTFGVTEVTANLGEEGGRMGVRRGRERGRRERKREEKEGRKGGREEGEREWREERESEGRSYQMLGQCLL